MNDSDFLEAIETNPCDPTPRLIYADWLDDQGDPRGELIRLLVEVERDLDSHPLWNKLLQSVKKCFGTKEIRALIELLDERQQRLFACDCAERVLPCFEQAYPNDNRPRAAIVVSRRFANGMATEQELHQAADDAFEAAEGVYVEVVEGMRTDPKGIVSNAGWAILGAVGNEAWRATLAENRGEFFVWLVERLLHFKTS